MKLPAYLSRTKANNGKFWRSQELKAKSPQSQLFIQPGRPFQLSLKAGHALLCKCCEWGLYYPFLIKLFLFQVAENSTQASLSKMGIYCIIPQNMNNLFFFFSFFLFICSEFCHTLEWNSHGFTCVPHPDPPSHLPLHPLPLGLEHE